MLAPAAADAAMHLERIEPHSAEAEMDPFTGSALIFIFGLAALISGVIAVGSLVRRGRLAAVPAVCAAVSVAAVIGSMMAMPAGYSAAERERVERLHAVFAPALERYRQTHGDYPPTLEAAGIPTPETEYGPLRYTRERSKNGPPAYSIAFGDYIHNGFVTWWDSDSRKWNLDQ
jgi:hypothetical protein